MIGNTLHITGKHAMRSHSGILYCLALAFGSLFAAGPRISAHAKEELSFPDHVKPFLSKYCYECHSGADAEAELNLELLRSERDATTSMKSLTAILGALEAAEMPPEGELQPSMAEQSIVIRWIKENVLPRKETPSPVVMRRLNRLEYDNTIRDLLRLNRPVFRLRDRVIRIGKADYFDPASGRMPEEIMVLSRISKKGLEMGPTLEGVSPLPIDPRAEHGFSNNGEVLNLSPLLMEKYLSLSTAIVQSPDLPKVSAEWKNLFVYSGDAAVNEAKARLKRFLPRAFRRPVDAAVLDRYTEYFETTYRSDKHFTRAMQKTVSVVLTSPRFLFKTEPTAGTVKRPLDNYEIASRLSYFLWSGMPDKELFALAAAGRLTERKVIATQVKRMLRDRKIKALTNNFAMQWLQLKSLASASPDKERFAEFYPRSTAMQETMAGWMLIEPLLLFETVLIEDRSIYDFVAADYAYLNPRLMQWYGIAGERSKGYRRVKLPDGTRGGVITTAAVLTNTSLPLRTSPVSRGAWVAEVLFNRPPPPPPAEVPSIDEDDQEILKKGLTLRKQFEEHRKNVSCAACHNRIDPLGFALENYDAIGRWRGDYGKDIPIDASGKIWGEHQFDNPTQFKTALLRDKSRFVRGFTEHVLSYALGRRLTVADRPTVDSIVKKVVADNGRFSTVFTEIATSVPFMYAASHTIAAPSESTKESKK